MSDLDVWLKRLARPASRMIVGGFRPPDDPFLPWFGKVLVAAEGEKWPMYEERPMWPLCQINCGELPYRPDILAGIAMIAVFISPKWPDDTPNGNGWCLRAYESTGELRPLVQPPLDNRIKPFPARWELIENDYPCYEDLPPDLPEDLRERCCESHLFENQRGTKVGGWPSHIQCGINWSPLDRQGAMPKYVFQIDSEYKANWIWGDNGTGYFGRGTEAHRDTWTMRWQCF